MSPRRDPAVLERNLRGLLRRSYRPVLARASFRAELKDLVLHRASDPRLLRSAAGAPVRRAWPVLALVSGVAAVLALAAAAWLLRTGPVLDAPTADELLARGLVALRSAPLGAWHAAEAESCPLREGAHLEVRTPPGRGFRVEAMPSGSVDVEPASAVDVVTAGAGEPIALKAWLRAGGAHVQRPEGGGAYDVDTRHGALRLARGDLTVRYQRHALDGVSQDSAWVHLASGDAALAGSAAAVEAGIDLRLHAGSIAPWRTAPPPAEREGVGDPSPSGPRAAAAPTAPGLWIAVLDEAGDPVAPATLWILTVREEGSAQPAYGEPPREIAVEDAAPVHVSDLPPGEYVVFARAPGYGMWRSREVRLAAAAAVRVEAVLRPPATVRGRVLDDATGEPIAGAFVFSEVDTPSLLVPLQLELLEAWGGLPPGTRTDAGGWFELTDLGRHRQRLRATASGHAPSWAVMDDPFLDLPELRLQRGGSFEGQVTDRRGQPLAGALVGAMAQHQVGDTLAQPFGMAFTGADGRYALRDMPEAMYVVFASDGSAGEETPDQAKIAPVVAAKVTQVDFSGVQQGVTVRGKLLDVRGEPVRNTVLSLAVTGASLDPFTAGWISAQTDAEGAFQVDVPAGAYEVFHIVDAGQAVHRIARLEAPSPGAVVLHLPAAAVRGRVVESDTGRPVAGALVILVDQDEDFAGKLTTGADGAFEFPAVPPGTYRVEAMPVSDHLAPASAGPVTVLDQLVSIDVRVAGGGVLLVQVMDAGGALVAGAQVAVHDAAGVELTAGWPYTSDERGTARVTGLPAGAVRVTVTLPEHPPVTVPALVAAGETRNVAVALPPRGP